MLLTLVTGKPKGMADFRRGLIRWLKQYRPGTASSCLCSAFYAVGCVRGLLRAAPGNSIPSLCWKRSDCSSPAIHPHILTPHTPFRGANVLIDWLPCLTQTNHQSQGRKYNWFTPGAGCGLFHPSHTAEYGTTGDPQRSRTAVWWSGRAGDWGGADRCPVIEGAVLFPASVMLPCRLPVVRTAGTLYPFLLIVAAFPTALPPALQGVTPASSDPSQYLAHFSPVFSPFPDPQAESGVDMHPAPCWSWVMDARCHIGSVGWDNSLTELRAGQEGWLAGQAQGWPGAQVPAAWAVPCCCPLMKTWTCSVCG